MSNQIQVPSKDQVNSASQAIFDVLKSKLGKVPNLYATIGYSSDALASFLDFSGKAGKGTFSGKEIEAIKLAVSEVNGCEYCLSAHSALAKMAGFTQDETLSLRATNIEDSRLRAITQLAANIAQNRGVADTALVQQFLSEGFDEKGLIDLLSVVAAITFTNYVYGTTQVPIDFPKAVALDTVVA